MFKKLKLQRLLGVTSILILMNLIGRMLGFLRETAIAYRYGASNLTDAYLVAFNFPNIFSTVIGGAFATVIIPLYNQVLIRSGEHEAKKMVANMLFIVFITLCLLGLLSIIFVDYIVFLSAPGFSQELKELTEKIFLFTIPTSILLSLGAFTTGVLNARKKFFIPSLSPLLNNLTLIVFVLFFFNLFGSDIYGLILGALVGAIIALIVQLPLFPRSTLDFNFIKSAEFKKAVHSSVPIMIGMLVMQLYLVIDKVLASNLIEGSISALNYANRLMTLGHGIFATAVATVVFPRLSELSAKGQMDTFHVIISKGVRLIAMFLVPLTVGLMLLGEPIIRLLFERGAFNSQDTYMTNIALIYFCVGMLPHGVNFILVKVFYAIEDTWTPIKVSLMSVILNVILSFTLMNLMGIGGLALANSIAAYINMILLIIILNKKNLIKNKVIVKDIIIVTICAIIMGIYLYLMSISFSVNTILQLGSFALSGALLYFVLLYFLGRKQFFS